jgi:hypothetical protein
MNYNERFIIAVQRTKDDKISFNNKILYFIIEKKLDTVHGPFSKEEYIQKREKLGVPKELQLNE